MTPGQTAIVAALIGVAYALTISLRGAVAPGIVGGILAAVLAFLVIRRVEAYNAEKRRRAAERRDSAPPPH